ncbi:MAG: M4 family metallopeptidase [Saprospiraceae bacterium]
MKNLAYRKYIYLLCFVLSSHLLFSQESLFSTTYECSNFNTFMTGDSIESLMYFTDTIYPSGIMDMDISKSGEYDGWTDLLPLMDIDFGTTFELTMTNINRFDPDKKYYRYQQYYQGLKVKGGGITVSAYTSDGPGDPCEVDFLIAPYIAADIDVSTTPTIDSSRLGTILSTSSQISFELMVSLDMEDDCEYHLVWEARYAVDGGSKISWVDAHTGAVLKTIDGYADLNAPTQVYGTKNLEDRVVSGTHSLISDNSRTRTFDFEATSCPTDENNWDTNLIPSTTDTVWTTEADSAVYQAHYVVTQIVPVFAGIGINFNKVDVAVCDIPDNAYSIDNGDRDSLDAFIIFGRTLNKSYALFDVAAHELTHAFLFDYLDRNKVGNKTLHEGIADMIGTYVESVIQGSVDWLMGDDVAEIPGRDLQNPEYDCMNGNVPNAEHPRSTPLGHWFYLISVGSGSSIPALGIEKATQIVLEALNLMGPESDYEQMKDATIAFVDEEYGTCSPESRAVRAAWQTICIGTSTCNFSIAGVNEVCEEGDSLHLFISGGVSGGTFNWIFPYEWTAEGCSPGSNLNGLCLNVTDFPKYNWYPQYFLAKAVRLGTGLQAT